MYQYQFAVIPSDPPITLKLDVDSGQIIDGLALALVAAVDIEVTVT